MKQEFLAILLVGAGSSHARGPDLEDTIKRCSRIAVDDWSSLFDLGGKEAQINVYDVTDHEALFWDERGVHPESDPSKSIDRLELRTVTLPQPKRRR
jgi:hypothetical protein